MMSAQVVVLVKYNACCKIIRHPALTIASTMVVCRDRHSSSATSSTWLGGEREEEGIEVVEATADEPNARGAGAGEGALEGAGAAEAGAARARACVSGAWRAAAGGGASAGE